MDRFARSNHYPEMRQIEAYWTALRDGRLVPNRSDVDPSGIEDSLDVTFIAERIAPGIGRIRIAGAHLGDVLGMEARGLAFSALFTPASRKRLSGIVDQVCDTPAIAQMSVTAERSMGKPELTGKVLLMPLRSDLGDITRILGAFCTDGAIGRAPRRFDIRDVDLQALAINEPHRVIAEAEPVMREMPGFAEPAAAGFDHVGSVPTKAPHLRLIKSD